MHIDLPEDFESEITQTATRRGVTPHALALHLLVEGIRTSRDRATGDELQTYLEDSLDLARATPAGTRFTLKELAMTRPWWSAVHVRDHNLIGELFRPAIENLHIADYLGPNSANAAEYRRR